jgi:hypothetical protein
MKKALKVFSIALLVTAAAAAGTWAETTRTLRGEMSAEGEFKVENLIGTMTVVAGSGNKVVVIATVTGESARVADMMEIKEVRDSKGRRTLRMIYPLDETTTFRSPGSKGGWLFGGGSNTRTKYAGTRVSVSGKSGMLLYADLEVQVPSGDINGRFHNVVGNINASDLNGTSYFDTGSGGIHLTAMTGTVDADTGSGEINATDIDGDFNGDTGSGDIHLNHFRGREISCDTGSGDIELDDVTADKINLDTGSGRITARDASARFVNADTGSGGIDVEGPGIEQFKADAGSGDVTFSTDGGSLRRVDVDTGSGDVEVRLDANAGFEAIADQASGDIKNRFSGAEPIIQGREVIGYRRGDARIRITVETGSGDMILQPR